MFNKRWKKILLWTLSIIVVLGVGGLFAANYAVDKLMNSMVDGFDLESEDQVSGGQDQGTAPEDTVVDGKVDPVASATPALSTDDDGSKDTEETGKIQQLLLLVNLRKPHQQIRKIVLQMAIRHRSQQIKQKKFKRM